MSQAWTWTNETKIPSDTKQGRAVLDELLSQLQRHEWAEHDVFGVHLAVEEALVNAIRHGNQNDPSKNVEVKCHMTSERLRVEIADEGTGFDPEDVPDPTAEENLEIPSGRGIMLMRTYMSFVEYNEVGNRVVMEKNAGEWPDDDDDDDDLFGDDDD